MSANEYAILSSAADQDSIWFWAIIALGFLNAVLCLFWAMILLKWMDLNGLPPTAKELKQVRRQLRIIGLWVTTSSGMGAVAAIITGSSYLLALFVLVSAGTAGGLILVILILWFLNGGSILRSSSGRPNNQKKGRAKKRNPDEDEP